MAKGKISKRSVDALISTERDEYLWDRELTGFGVKITPKGKRMYFIQYRLGGRKGRTRRITIGQHGTLTPEQARVEAKRYLGIVASGKDPAENRDQERKSFTLKAAADQFVVEHIRSKLKPSTAREYERLLQLHIIPAIGSIKIHNVTRTQVASLHHKMRNTPRQANQSLAVLSKLLSWAEKRGMRSEGVNPCRNIEKYTERRRERFLSEAELARMGNKLIEKETNRQETPWVIAAIRLLALTGARLSEILTLQWDFVNFENALLHLPDSKTGSKTIYLNAPALEVLGNIPRLDGNPYVICGKKPGAHLVNLHKPWRRIRKEAGLDDVRLHDLRHSFASMGAIGGTSLPIIGALLGHSQPATTARYAHLSADPLKAASDAIGGRIAGAMAGNAKGRIVPFPSK